MRSAIATAALGVAVAALVAAAVVGFVQRPLPDEIALRLVEISEAADGRPLVEVTDGPDGVLTDRLDVDEALVDALQVACLGGSLADVPAGVPVTVVGVDDVRDTTPPTILAERAIIECG